jgi:Transposase
MAPILFHGLNQLGLPVVCVESRQAYQALKSLATHKTDRNDARGLAHLARTGFFKPVYVKSLSAHALRSLISARKKLVGQRVTLENQIRGLAVVFVVRLAASYDVKRGQVGVGFSNREPDRVRVSPLPSPPRRQSSRAMMVRWSRSLASQSRRGPRTVHLGRRRQTRSDPVRLDELRRSLPIVRA